MSDDGLRGKVRRLRAHIDGQYRLIEDVVNEVESGDTGESVDDLLHDISLEAGRAKAIADEIREAYYHTA